MEDIVNEMMCTVSKTGCTKWRSWGIVIFILAYTTVHQIIFCVICQLLECIFEEEKFILDG